MRKPAEGWVSTHGYAMMWENGKEKRVHRHIAEKALGKPLPKGAVVHHWDRNRMNNANENLLICPDHAYHRLIHRRMEAMEATGDPSARRCEICGGYDSPDDLRNLRANRDSMAHRRCVKEANRLARQRRGSHGRAPVTEDSEASA